MSAAAPRIWFEVEDFLRHFDHSPSPSGIQRVCLELYAEIARRYSGAAGARFCRLNLVTQRLEAVDFERILETYRHPPRIFEGEGGYFGRLARLRLEFCRFRNTLRRCAWQGIPRLFHRLAEHVVAPPPPPLAPGDVLVCLGSPWINGRHAPIIAGLRRRLGIRVVLLIHDIVPLTSGPWHEADPPFGHWLARMIPVADLLFTVSRYSRDDLRRWAAERGWPLPPVEVLRLGAGFGAWRDPPRARPAPPPLPERFVLFVSTIEIRKNHAGLFAAWRRLVERHGAAAVPELVFAGKLGWWVEGFMAELAASRYLDGKIRHLAELDDAALGEAYGRCLFTVYPSLYEGWGLPVAESLMHGKLCIASRRTSIPEVGGAFADYFDPEDIDDMVRALERALFEPGYVAAREAAIRAEYRPPGWVDCAAALMSRLGALHGAAAPAAPAAAAAVS